LTTIRLKISAGDDKVSVEISAIALGGMNQAQTRLEGTANRLAKAADPAAADTVDLSAEMVALMEARNAFAVNAKVAATGDELQKSVIDLLA
jgi:flagellar hook-associated protein FlgK